MKFPNFCGTYSSMCSSIDCSGASDMAD
uniref:Uncharacterized protein n=1 Tax=Lepeophtheirus salmonis TaxID=72036 RepID=A0A0K2UES7_LEPSM